MLYRLTTAASRWSLSPLYVVKSTFRRSFCSWYLSFRTILWWLSLLFLMRLTLAGRNINYFSRTSDRRNVFPLSRSTYSVRHFSVRHSPVRHFFCETSRTSMGVYEDGASTIPMPQCDEGGCKAEIQSQGWFLHLTYSPSWSVKSTPSRTTIF